MFRFQQYKLPKAEIEEHLNTMLQEIKAHGSFVLCHCDFHIRNIVYDEDTGKYMIIVFISSASPFDYLLCLSILIYIIHYSDVIMNAIESQITSVLLFAETFVKAQINKNIKTPRQWPLWGESTGGQWIRLTKGQ